MSSRKQQIKARRRARNHIKRKQQIQFPDTSDAPLDINTGQPTIQPSSNNKRNKIRSISKRAAVKTFLRWIFPVLSLPYLLLDTRTTYTSLKSMAYLWISFTILYISYLFREDLSSIFGCDDSIETSVQQQLKLIHKKSKSKTLSGASKSFSRTRQNQAGRTQKKSKSSVEVKYNQLINANVVKGKVKNPSVQDMNTVMSSRGNITGYYKAIQHYKEQYELKIKQKLNEIQFRLLVKAVGVARNELMQDLNVDKAMVSVVLPEVDEGYCIVDFDGVMSRELFRKMNGVGGKVE
jgi:hypothetical protein